MAAKGNSVNPAPSAVAVRPTSAVSFGPYRLEPNEGWLRQGDSPVHLRPKTWEVLCVLVANAGQLLTKRDILATVWGGSVVSDTMPSISVAEIRRALGDDAQRPYYIETVHGRGFRFIGHLREDGVSGSALARPLASGVTTTIVGRHAEQGALEAFLGRADPNRRIAFVAGEAGIGKTTLVNRVVAPLISRGGGAPGYCVGRGQCLATFGEGYPYWPVLAALQGLARDRPELPQLLREVAPSWLARLPMLMTPTELGGVHRAAEDASAVRVVEELFALVQALGGVVWVFEDLHWADAATLDLLALMSESPALGRVWVVGTTRVFDAVASGHGIVRLRRELRRRGRCLEISLSGLSEEEIHEYLTARLAATSFPATLAGRLLSHTAGNPLFLTHTVDHLIGAAASTSSDLFANEGDGAVATALAAVPATLRDLVREDVATLPPEQRAALTAASVAGLEFEAAAVAAAVQTSVASADDVCCELAQRTPLVSRVGESSWPDGTVGGRYAFRHPLYQRVVYDDQAPAARRAAHRRIGDAMAAAFGDAVGGSSALLAEHFERGGDVERAVEYHRRAAEVAGGGSAAREAALHLRRALALANQIMDRERQERELLSELGKVLPAVQGFGDPALLSLYLRVRTLQAAGGDVAGEVAAIAGLLLTNLMQSRPQAAEELAREMLDLTANEQDPSNRAQAELLMGAVLYHHGDLAGAVAHAERALALAPSGLRLGPIDHQSAASIMLGAALWQVGRPDDGLRHARRGLELARNGLDPFNVVIGLQSVIAIHHWRGEVAEVVGFAGELAAGAQEQGIVQAEACAALLSAWADLQTGDFDNAGRGVERGLSALKQHGSMMQSVYLLTVAAEVLMGLERLGEATGCLDEAAALVEDGAARWWEPEISRWRGLLAARTGAGGGLGRAHLERALELAAQQEAQSLRLRAATALVDAGEARGRRHRCAVVNSILAEIIGGVETRDVMTARRVLEEEGAGATPRKPRPTTRSGRLLGRADRRRPRK